MNLNNNHEGHLINQVIDTDVLIVGAGPVGLFSVFACGMQGLKCEVVDAFQTIGGQCAALYPEKPIYDIAGFASIDAQTLIDNLAEQAAPFKPGYHLDQQVIKIEAQNECGNSWMVTTSSGQIFNTKVILIAAGVGAFGPNKPPLSTIADYEKNSIHYSVRHQNIYKNKNIVIAGGGDSAVDWAIILKDIAKKVYVVHRRAQFRATPENQKKLQLAADRGELELIIPYQLHGLTGANNLLESVQVIDFNNEIKSLEADILLPFFGLAMNLGPINDWALDLNNHHIEIDYLTGQTNRAGIYAAGDIATYKHKQKLILTGFAEASQAAHHMREFIHPEKIVHFSYSTSKGVPGF